MACELFGGVSIHDHDFGDIFRKFVDSCIADGKHPRAKWVSEKDLALYCCDSPTDPLPISAPSNLPFDLTLGGLDALALFLGTPATLPFGDGHIEIAYVPPPANETVCIWKSEKYSVGSIVKQDDGKCHRCEVDGTWALGVDCAPSTAVAVDPGPVVVQTPPSADQSASNAKAAEKRGRG
jgi:hypothetical protein